MNNMNPWIIQALVEYDRERIRRNMEQIRLEEEAMQASRTKEKTTKTRVYHSRRLTLIVSTLVKWMVSIGR